jgi:hypothetical protein
MTASGVASESSAVNLPAAPISPSPRMGLRSAAYRDPHYARRVALMKQLGNGPRQLELLVDQVLPQPRRTA